MCITIICNVQTYTYVWHAQYHAYTIVCYWYLRFSSPYTRSDHGVAKPHGSRLEDVSNLRIDGRVVPTAVKVEGVSWCGLVREPVGISLVLSIEEYWQPLIIHNVLVCGNGELTGSVE